MSNILPDTPPTDPDVAPRFGHCTCSCHVWPGVKHLTACCGPSFEEPGLVLT